MANKRNKCPECNGHGQILAYFWRWIECPTCKGAGEKKHD